MDRVINKFPPENNNNINKNMNLLVSLTHFVNVGVCLPGLMPVLSTLHPFTLHSFHDKLGFSVNPFVCSIHLPSTLI
jgi:hypothetical protein